MSVLYNVLILLHKSVLVLSLVKCYDLERDQLLNTLTNMPCYTFIPSNERRIFSWTKTTIQFILSPWIGVWVLLCRWKHAKKYEKKVVALIRNCHGQHPRICQVLRDLETSSSAKKLESRTFFVQKKKQKTAHLPWCPVQSSLPLPWKLDLNCSSRDFLRLLAGLKLPNHVFFKWRKATSSISKKKLIDTYDHVHIIHQSWSDVFELYAFNCFHATWTSPFRMVFIRANGKGWPTHWARRWNFLWAHDWARAWPNRRSWRFLFVS